MGYEDNDGAFQCANCHEYEQERIRQQAEIERLRARVTEVTAQLALRCRAEACDKEELLEEIERLRQRLEKFEELRRERDEEVERLKWELAAGCD